MTSKKGRKPTLHRKEAPPENTPPEEPPKQLPEGEDSEEYTAFEDFARRVFAVPKSEIDEEERKGKKRES